jgi:hypothetical protein
MIRSRRLMAGFVAVVGSLLLWMAWVERARAAGNPAQQPGPGSVPTFQANANLVLVDVVVVQRLLDRSHIRRESGNHPQPRRQREYSNLRPRRDGVQVLQHLQAVASPIESLTVSSPDDVKRFRKLIRR